MLHKNIKIKESKINGMGIFATDSIQKDEIVWQLSLNEEFFSVEDALKLPDEKRELVFRYGDKYVLCTDGSQFMNHSCNPNLWFLDDITLIAKRDIEAREEITYDYTTTEVDPVYHDEWQCLCGSKNCRGKISPYHCLNNDFQELHKGHLPSYTIEYIKKNKKEF